MSLPSRAFRWTIRGRVQGVGFRWFVRRAAEQSGVVGRVRNRRDGTVEILVAGDDSAVGSFRRQVEQGPPGAVVRGMDEEEMTPAPSWSRFEIGF